MESILYEDNPLEYNAYLKDTELEDISEDLPEDIIKPLQDAQPSIINMYLRLASKQLDRNYYFKGNKLELTQYLAFPREDGTIPYNIKVATALTAQKLFDKAGDKGTLYNSASIRREKIGRTLERENFSFKDMDITNQDKNKSMIDNLIDIFLSDYITTVVNVCRG